MTLERKRLVVYMNTNKYSYLALLKMKNSRIESGLTDFQIRVKDKSGDLQYSRSLGLHNST